MCLDEYAGHHAIVPVVDHGQWRPMAIGDRQDGADEDDLAPEPFVRQHGNRLRGIDRKGRRFDVRLRAPRYLDLVGRSLHTDQRNRLAGVSERHSGVCLARKDPADGAVEGVGREIGTRSKIGWNEVVQVGQLIFVHDVR